jgi:hypothetical protein
MEGIVRFIYFGTNRGVKLIQMSSILSARRSMHLGGTNRQLTLDIKIV